MYTVKESKLFLFFFSQKNEPSQAGVGMYILCSIIVKKLSQILPLYSLPFHSEETPG